MTTGPESGGSVPADPHAEQLSAWLDDEITGAEAALFSGRVAHSQENPARLARYALIGGSLRGATGTAMRALALSQRVRAALDAEKDGKADSATVADPAPFAVSAVARARVVGPAWLPYALAAGLAVIAVVLVPLLRPSEPAPPPPPLASAWRVDAVPAKFRLQAVRTQRSQATAAPIEHLVYSDGIATVSVFIEPGVAAAEQGQGQFPMGAANAYTTVNDGYLITAVGGVPVRTVEAISRSVRKSADVSRP